MSVTRRLPSLNQEPPSPDGVPAPAETDGLADIQASLRALDGERRLCEARFTKLADSIASAEAACRGAQAASEHAAEARARFIASMRPELLTPLHTVLGYCQLLRMGGGLDAMQSLRVGAMQAAGVHLLERIHFLLEYQSGNVDADAASEEADAGRSALAATRVAFLPAPNVTPSWLAAARPLRVLIVDDAEINRDIAASFLRSAGHSVVLAETGEQALAASSSGEFDVIMMDIRMPGMDGLEAARRIRALSAPRGRVPIIALTVTTTADQMAQCREAGMNGYVTKPFTQASLIDVCERAADLLHPGAPDMTHSATATGHGERGAWLASAPAAAGGAVREPLWLTVQSPWDLTQLPAPPASRDPAMRTRADDAFALRLRYVGPAHNRRLIDPQTSCLPAQDQHHHELHWLVFVEPAFAREPTVNAACDLWRWSRGNWINIAVSGARFSPVEMHEQGWRYCGPCGSKIVKLEILTDVAPPSDHVVTSRGMESRGAD